MAASAWSRRNDRARALGYRNYYDYRAHDYGRRPAAEPPARGPELERLRGHRGAADLDRLLQRGEVELVNVIQVGPNESEVLVTLADGSTRTYTVKGPKAIAKTKATIDELGPDGPQVVGSPKARKMLAELDAEEEEELREEETVMTSDEGIPLLSDEEIDAATDDGIPF